MKCHDLKNTWLMGFFIKVIIKVHWRQCHQYTAKFEVTSLPLHCTRCCRRCRNATHMWGFIVLGFCREIILLNGNAESEAGTVSMITAI